MRTKWFAFLRGFDAVSIFVLFVHESFRRFAGVRPVECGDACSWSFWVYCVAVVCECAGEGAAGGGGTFDLVRLSGEMTGEIKAISLGEWGAACCAPTWDCVKVEIATSQTCAARLRKNAGETPFEAQGKPAGSKSDARLELGFFFGVDQVAVGGFVGVDYFLG